MKTGLRDIQDRADCEMLVRRLAHRMGHRFRLHRTDLPGKPDLALMAVRVWQYAHEQWFPITGVARWEELAPIKTVWVD